MLAASFAALLFALALVACGDGESSSTAATPNQQPQNGQADKGRSGGSTSPRGAADGGKGREGQGGGGEAADFIPKQHEDSGGGAAQYERKGGDNSVQEFGQEADTSEFEAAAAALHNYLDARAQGNWDAVCRYLSKATIQSLERPAAQVKSAAGCAGALEKITNPAAKQLLVEEAVKADIGSLRGADGRGYLIYTAGDRTILAMPMAREGGEWKVAGLAATPLN